MTKWFIFVHLLDYKHFIVKIVTLTKKSLSTVILVLSFEHWLH